MKWSEGSFIFALLFIHHSVFVWSPLSSLLQEPLFTLSHTVESGRGKCPFSPKEPFAARLTGRSLPPTRTRRSGLKEWPYWIIICHSLKAVFTFWWQRRCAAYNPTTVWLLAAECPLSRGVCGPHELFHALTSAAAPHDIKDIKHIGHIWIT